MCVSVVWLFAFTAMCVLMRVVVSVVSCLLLLCARLRGGQCRELCLCVRVRLCVQCLHLWWFVCGANEVVHVVCVHVVSACVQCDCSSGSVFRLMCVVCTLAHVHTNVCLLVVRIHFHVVICSFCFTSVFPVFLRLFQLSSCCFVMTIS